MCIIWKAQTVAIGVLKHPERIVRIHGEKQIAEIRRSIRFAVQRRPLIIDEENTVLVGIGLLTAVQAKGFATIWCMRGMGMRENQKK